MYFDGEMCWAEIVPDSCRVRSVGYCLMFFEQLLLCRIDYIVDYCILTVS